MVYIDISTGVDIEIKIYFKIASFSSFRNFFFQFQGNTEKEKKMNIYLVSYI